MLIGMLSCLPATASMPAEKPFRSGGQLVTNYTHAWITIQVNLLISYRLRSKSGLRNLQTGWHRIGRVALV